MNPCAGVVQGSCGGRAGIVQRVSSRVVQGVLQGCPTEDLKGRMMGTMNLINFCGIVASALAFFALRNLWAQLELPISWTFPVLATVVLPVALLFRPPETKL